MTEAIDNDKEWYCLTNHLEHATFSELMEAMNSPEYIGLQFICGNMQIQRIK